MGYIQGGHCIEAIKILYAMKAAGLQPQESLLNEVRFTCGSRDFVNKTDAKMDLLITRIDCQGQTSHGSWKLATGALGPLAS
ncbi:hypothetical protein U1Q18_022632 [Sarracenia purpurea var. burkii]